MSDELMTTKEAIEQLQSNDCRCGNEKKSGQSFCSWCYRSLPRAIRNALYNHIGCGYEQAYQLACKTLDEMEAQV